MNSKTLRETVAQQLADVGTERVRNTLVNVLVDKELDRRVKLVLEALDKRDALVAEGRKIKADVVSYNADGSVAQEAWSKAKLEERNKHQQQLDKLEAAIEAALERADFSKLS
jgi:hypothetical protein